MAADTDADGIDAGDNCPAVFNPLQADCNGDGVGDACNLAGAAGADSDRDGRCDAVDNCATVPNIDQGDCNGGGAGDMCEGATANRDDDRDGVCNGVDACPYEAGSCAMQAITVPWVPANPSIPHSTYSGATHTLKGIARYGGNQYMWDFGDASAPTAWTAIANAYNLGVNHVYSGAVGQTFIATLSVRNSATPATVATATYRVKIADSGPLPANNQMDPNKMDVRIDMAIDQGLWYLHTTMTRTTFADGANGYAQRSGNWAGVLAGTCTAVDAFELHGSKPNKDYATDPYVETTQRGLNHILANAATGAIGNQVHGAVTDRPDYDLNGIGIRFGANDTYTNGICGVAFASAGTPTRQAYVGAANIRGRTYKELAQDMAEWFAWGQSDSGTFRGGWLYSANSNGADGSTNQWPLLAIAAAEDNMAIKTPAFVRTEAPFFMNYSRHAALDNRNGGWGYTSPNDVYVNHVKTAAGMLFHYFEGDTTAHPNVKAALGYLYRYWAANNYDGGGAWNVGLGNSYAMYGIMKAMRKPQPNILRVTEYNYNAGVQTANSFDWYYTPIGQTQEGLATNLVKRQAAGGNWSDTIGNNAGSVGVAGTTGWDILILSKGVTTIPPEAEICDCTLTWDNNQNITLDGSCSNHPDLNRTITAWEWDFNYNVATFDVDATGQHGTLVGGFNTYGNHPVALRVTDDNPIALGGPQTSIATCTIVTKPPNNCPHPSAGGPYLGTHDEPVQFDASASFDPDGDNLAYAWDLDNDGQFDDATGVNPTWTYANLGIFTIAVQVTDLRVANPDGSAGPCSRVAFSTVEIGNHAPVADPGGPYSGRPGTVVTLNGSGSSDPDGDMITFGWDLNNDGTFNDSASITPAFNIPANAPIGTVYSVCLKVTDEFGRVSDPRCTTVTVQHLNTAPTCSLPQPAIVAECTGGPVTVTVDGSASQDADGGDTLSYTWTTNCAGGTFANPNAAMTTLTLGSGGACSAGCSATLSVSDGTAATTCSRVVNIIDETNPTFTSSPANLTVECNAMAPAAVAAWLNSAGASDVCTATGVANDFTTLGGGCGGATGSAHVTWTATDACSNDAQVAADLAVVDTTAPALACPAATTVECNAHATEVSLVAGANDACFGALPTAGPNTALYPVGTTAVEFTAVDACNNASSCSTSVTVTDTTSPSIACPADTTNECNANHAATGIVVGAATGSDVCGDTTISGGVAGGFVFPLGTTAVSQEATDESNNHAICTSNVTVVDTTAPALACPANVVVECNAAGSATGVSAGTATASDVCTATTVTDPAVAAYPLGTTTTIHGAVDELGNRNTCTNTVTVRDTIGPAFNAGSLGPRTVLGTCANAPVSFTLPTASDVCQATTVTCNPLPGNSIGANNVTCTATDLSGNQTTVAIVVNVLAPLRLMFRPPLEDDNVADDTNTDADVANLFKVGSTVPHKIKLVACNGTDVTGAFASQVTLRLTETYRTGVGNASTAIVPEYNGQGDAGGVLNYDGSQFHYNLSTNAAKYPAGTAANAAYFSSLITATYNAAPGIIAGREDARLESK